MSDRGSGGGGVVGGGVVSGSEFAHLAPARRWRRTAPSPQAARPPPPCEVSRPLSQKLSCFSFLSVFLFGWWVVGWWVVWWVVGWWVWWVVGWWVGRQDAISANWWAPSKKGPIISYVQQTINVPATRNGGAYRRGSGTSAHTTPHPPPAPRDLADRTQSQSLRPIVAQTR